MDLQLRFGQPFEGGHTTNLVDDWVLVGGGWVMVRAVSLVVTGCVSVVLGCNSIMVVSVGIYGIGLVI